MQKVLSMTDLPEKFSDEKDLEEFMSRPSATLIDEMAQMEGDLMILGVGGKMGPTLARLAQRSLPKSRIIGVARFSDPEVKEKLETWGVETIACDLLEREAIEKLPQVENIIYMAGRKFGTTGASHLTWAMNAYVPGMVGEIFSKSRIVAFSTGCVYPFVSVLHQGSTEDDEPFPPSGDYANSCVGRERMFEYFSHQNKVPGRLIRLNYSIDMRYGVLHDVGSKVLAGETIDLTMGHVNVIWQGDANSQILRALNHCTAPTSPLNISGPETISVKALALAFGKILNKEPIFQGEEGPSAWLVNTAQAVRLFGYPLIPLPKMIDWVADWISGGKKTLGKATHFEVRDGNY
jgi:nucleoside-diphosphate-sugar epimerase